ncbi:RAM signaling pathway protein-domain-containing protein [Hygrophoropsis aurantiaca]|uniref:RAM signaling pathway protein-domain-containing protein n=1 Tax=Hygrophoropsis aurantiaca TaxID=72124 RepID=A0ACB8A6C0_9AGAM|nr:RAM signaling pathway protein-domain-containing protein [Hygrophoropsis aurantiaca]
MSLMDNDRVAGRTSPFPNSSKSGALSPLPSASLTEEHISEALLQSPDDGATLDLTHRNLADVGEDGAQSLATIGRGDSLEEDSSVLRIALGYNRLATLPTAFALLSRLRYLNLKNNSFSVFPDVLTLMDSLEILDISRNKIKRLPAQPGSLVNLRVFSMSRNKLTKLPSYVADFHSLNVMKLDHNPIEWPPKSVLDFSGSIDDAQNARNWISSVQQWLRDHSPSHNDQRKPSVDSLLSESAALDNSIEDTIQSWTRFHEDDNDPGVTPHARSFSIDSEFPPMPDVSHLIAQSPRFERPPPLRLGTLPPFNGHPRSSSPESYLPTPEESVSSTDDENTAVPEGHQHTRNASYASGSRDRRPALFGKKSLPDLKIVKMSDKDAPKSISEPALTHPNSSESLKADATYEFSIPSPLSHRQGSSSSSEGSAQSRLYHPSTHTPPSSSPTSVERIPPAETERHAYFKRLSALPANAISTNLPPSLRILVECSRSIFFAVSQVHQALSHYITHTLDEQLSSVLKKVTDPAYTYMMQLNTALERFDAMGKVTTPPPTLCRALVESSRDSAAVFGKAIAMLALQLKIIASKDDDRYMRSLILIFYGAIAEISCAWQSMAPHIEAVKPHLADSRRGHGGKAHSTSNGIPSPELPPASAPAIFSPFNVAQHSTPMARSRPTQQNGLGRVRTTRRHAGSFSSKDVEIGRSLPSYDLPPRPIGAITATPSTLRAGLRHPALPLSASTSSLAPSLMSSTSFGAFSSQNAGPLSPSTSGQLMFSMRKTNHSRQTSQASLTTSSSSSSPLTSQRRPTLEIPPSRTLVDKDALRAMGVAVEAAPAVWDMIKEIMEGVSEAKGADVDIQESLHIARATTERLRTNIHATRCGDPAADRKALREDAHVFVKIVVKLSNFVKTYGSSHALFSDLRAKMVALTNATQEFVMLLHVSSFSPSSTPRPYSPMTGPSLAHPNFSSMLEDGRLGANLSRSRSTQQPKSLKLSASATRELPRSALPNQSFNISVPQRTGDGRNGDVADGS